ncbi:MAG: hemerythrin domain-containing protein [Acidiferrobacteraceae bacterium]
MFPAPAPGFDDPIGMLGACHERILRHGRWLKTVAEGGDPAALAAVYRYFSTAGQDHHADEEQDLFPLLGRPATVLIQELLAQHRSLDRLWEALAPGFGDPGALQGSLAETVHRFVSLNESHIALENRELLPLAVKLLTPNELAVLGQHMAQRRGVEL